MILLDTCVLHLIIRSRFVPRSSVCVSAVTLGEGVRVMERSEPDALSEAVAHFLESLDEDCVLAYGTREARVFSRIASRMSSPKRVPDIMIAATALAHDLKLVTADRRMAGLQGAIGNLPDFPRLRVEFVEP